MNNEQKLARKAELEAKRDAHKKLAEERELDAELKALDLEVRALDLVARFEKELGPRGKAFELIDISDVEDAEPFLIVRTSDILSFKNFVSQVKKSNGDATFDEMIKFVAPALAHPTKDKGLEILDRRPGAAMKACIALQELAGVRERETQGKY